MFHELHRGPPCWTGPVPPFGPINAMAHYWSRCFQCLASSPGAQGLRGTQTRPSPSQFSLHAHAYDSMMGAGKVVDPSACSPLPLLNSSFRQYRAIPTNASATNQLCHLLNSSSSCSMNEVCNEQRILTKLEFHHRAFAAVAGAHHRSKRQFHTVEGPSETRRCGAQGCPWSGMQGHDGAVQAWRHEQPGTPLPQQHSGIPRAKQNATNARKATQGIDIGSYMGKTAPHASQYCHEWRS